MAPSSRGPSSSESLSASSCAQALFLSSLPLRCPQPQRVKSVLTRHCLPCTSTVPRQHHHSDCAVAGCTISCLKGSIGAFSGQQVLSLTAWASLVFAKQLRTAKGEAPCFSQREVSSAQIWQRSCIDTEATLRYCIRDIGQRAGCPTTSSRCRRFLRREGTGASSGAKPGGRCGCCGWLNRMSCSFSLSGCSVSTCCVLGSAAFKQGLSAHLTSRG